MDGSDEPSLHIDIHTNTHTFSFYALLSLQIAQLMYIFFFNHAFFSVSYLHRVQLFREPDPVSDTALFKKSKLKMIYNPQLAVASIIKHLFSVL